MGDSENYVIANPLSTPASIVPEWYFLPFYAILRSIPSKILGVICMGGAICILFALPLLDRSKTRGIQFKPLMKISFWAFIANFMLLTKLGGLHPEEPYITLGLISSIFYFSWFLLILPLVSSIENNMVFYPYRGWKKNSTLPLTHTQGQKTKVLRVRKEYRYYSTSTTNELLEKATKNAVNNNSDVVVPLMIYNNMSLLKNKSIKKIT